MNLYPEITSDDDLRNVLNEIIKERRNDVGDFDALYGQFVKGRKVGKVPTATNDTESTDKEGDINYDTNFLYLLLSNAGTLEWYKAQLKEVDDSFTTETFQSYGGYGTNLYYFGLGYRTSGNIAVSANRLYCRPFVVWKQTTFTRIGCYVQTLAGGTNARLGIYNWVGGRPTSLVLDAGTVSTATTGEKEITISQSLDRGCYGLAIVHSGTPTMWAASGGDDICQELVATNAAGSGYTAVYKAHTYGALPDPFGSPTLDSATNQPALWMRVV